MELRVLKCLKKALKYPKHQIALMPGLVAQQLK